MNRSPLNDKGYFPSELKDTFPLNFPDPYHLFTSRRQSGPSAKLNSVALLQPERGVERKTVHANSARLQIFVSVFVIDSSAGAYSV